MSSQAKRLKRLLSNTLLNKAYIAETGLRIGIESALERYAGGIVLDVGCGTKPFESFLQALADFDRYLAMEYPGSVDYFAKSIKDVAVFGDVQSLPMKNDLADVILCSEVLEHVPEPQRAIRDAYRVLKPGGVYIMSVPNTFKLHEEPHDYYRFTVYGVRYLLSKAGFEILEIRPRGNSPAALGQSFVSYIHESLVLSRDTGQPSHWRAALLLPFFALIQGIALILDRFSKSEAFTIGYIAVGRKPATETSEATP